MTNTTEQQLAHTANNGALATTGGDPFSSYGAKVGTAGQFLTFKNGEWLHGQDSAMLALGTRLIANVGGLRVGWKRWSDAKVTDDLLELLIDQKPLAQRNTLGDTDPALWEKDDAGKPRDPWQFTNELTMIGGPDTETFIFATASKGGIGAIGRLCKSYGQAYRQRPGMAPIIELGADSYIHPVYKKTYVPVLTIVDWVDENAASGGAAVEEAAPAASGAKKARF